MLPAVSTAPGAVVGSYCTGIIEYVRNLRDNLGTDLPEFLNLYWHKAENVQARQSRVAGPVIAVLALAVVLLLNPAWVVVAAEPKRDLPLPGEVFDVQGRTAFIIVPGIENRHSTRPTPWVWYAPTLPKLPEARERWMFERFLAAGIAVAGVDVGESYGSPQGRAVFSALYRELVERRGFSRKPCLLARSRGGLMLYNWAAEHPESVGGIAGIYPVCNLRSWPGLDKACGAYGLTAAQLDKQLAQHNPIDRLAPLARAGVPIFHIHGDADKTVPLADNSGELARRYRELGGSMQLRIAPGQDHNVWEGFFQCEELVEFVIAHANPAAEPEPSAALFQNPPMDARVGAYWVWLNGNVDIAEITRELEEMKAKGMSGAEIWDVGLINPNPGMTVAAGPAFLGPESLAAIHHAINEATRLGLHLGLVTSSSWNEGGSWIEPKDALKALYVSATNFTGPARIALKLLFPPNRAAKGTDGFPLYHQEIAVLAFPRSAQGVIPDVASVSNISGKISAVGELLWDVPPGEWTVMRFVNATTGQKLVIPSPLSSGLMVDHMDAGAQTRNYNYIFKQLLKDGPGFGALKYMQEDSVEINMPQKTGGVADWTESFIAEFQQRRGYDPTPYLPVLAGKQFGDSQIAERFYHDYRQTVSDLWIDRHYGVARAMLHERGLQFAGEPGHGGYPRAEVLRALGSIDVPRGEFWNTRKNWVTKEAASAAHIYGLKYADAESFTGWRSWQDGPFELKRLADTAFCDGMNRMTIHNFAHSPPGAGLPGYCYHAGEHINVNTTWWPQSAPFFAYLDRCCYMLQQGLPVADACFYYGDDAPNLVATRRIDTNPKRLDADICAHCGRTNPAPSIALGNGYDYDVVNSDVILTRMEVKNGRLTLPDGMSYAVLVLPDRADMPLGVLEKIEKLVREGATVLGTKPVHSSGLTGYPKCDAEIQSLAARVWGECDGQLLRKRAYGRGWIVWDRNRVREILQQRKVIPDFAYSGTKQAVHLDYIHRRTPDADIYFVSNTQTEDVETDCLFRVTPQPAQLWFPDTGEIQACPDSESVVDGVKLRLRLPAAGSVFVVFGSKVEPTLPVATTMLPPSTVARLEIAGPWEVNFPPNLGAPPSRVFEKLVSWTTIPDDGVKYFSGTATYLKEFEVLASLLAHGDQLELDLGQLRNVAEVTLNGQALGIRWKPPFTYEVTGSVRAGKNTLVVKITNVWANRLAGDALLPQDKRITRIAQKVAPGGPGEAGLFGPVQLRFASSNSATPAASVNRPLETNSDR